MGLPVFTTPHEPLPTVEAASEKLSSNVRSTSGRHRFRSASRTEPPPRRVTSSIRRRWSPEVFLDSETEQRSAIGSQEHDLTDVGASVVSNRRRGPLERAFEERLMRARALVDSGLRNRISNPDTSSLAPEVSESRNRTFAEYMSSRTARLHGNTRSYLRRSASRPEVLPSSSENEESGTHRLSRVDIDWTDPYSNNPEYQLLVTSLHGLEPPDPPIDSSLPPRAYTPINPTLLERIRELNRTSTEIGRSRQNSRQMHLDGLGDRNRSLSPESGAAWQNLLTSLSPNSRPPRDRTSLSSPPPIPPAVVPTSSTISRRPIFVNATNTSSASDTEPLPYVNYVPHTGTDPDDDVDEPLDFRIPEQIPPILRSLLFLPHTVDIEDLAVWHCLISRLSEREDIPDEWWISAGLTRNVRETSGT